jgi:tetratricopeptide (TPR) repeat protein
VIFDLKSGKRRKVVQVVFGFLAFIFFISFVGFGIGSDVSGGIFDALGIGGGSNSSDPQFDQQISDAEDAIEANPDDGDAYADLITAYYQSASTGVTTDQTTGQQSITEDARADLEAAAQAWADYLKTDPEKPSVDAAARAVQVFVLLGDARNAASAQQIVADSQKSGTAYYQLVLYLYADGQIKAGDEAADLAVDAIDDPTQKKQLQKQLEGLRKQAIKYQQQLEQQAQQNQENGGAGGELDNPFGSLGGAGGSTGAPITPTP